MIEAFELRSDSNRGARACTRRQTFEPRLVRTFERVSAQVHLLFELLKRGQPSPGAGCHHCGVASRFVQMAVGPSGCLPHRVVLGTSLDDHVRENGPRDLNRLIAGLVEESQRRRPQSIDPACNRHAYPKRRWVRLGRDCRHRWSERYGTKNCTQPAGIRLCQ